MKTLQKKKDAPGVVPHDYEPRRARPVDGGQDALKPLVLRARGRKVVVEDVVGQRDDHGDVGDLAHRPRVVGRRRRVGRDDGAQRRRGRAGRELLRRRRNRVACVVGLLPGRERPGAAKVIASRVSRVLAVERGGENFHFRALVIADGRHGRNRCEQGLPQARKRVPPPPESRLVDSVLVEEVRRVGEAGHAVELARLLKKMKFGVRRFSERCVCREEKSR